MPQGLWTRKEKENRIEPPFGCLDERMLNVERENKRIISNVSKGSWCRFVEIGKCRRFCSTFDFIVGWSEWTGEWERSIGGNRTVRDRSCFEIDIDERDISRRVCPWFVHVDCGGFSSMEKPSWQTNSLHSYDRSRTALWNRTKATDESRELFRSCLSNSHGRWERLSIQQSTVPSSCWLYNSIAISTPTFIRNSLGRSTSTHRNNRRKSNCIYHSFPKKHKNINLFSLDRLSSLRKAAFSLSSNRSHAKTLTCPVESRRIPLESPRTISAHSRRHSQKSLHRSFLRRKPTFPRNLIKHLKK